MGFFDAHFPHNETHPFPSIASLPSEAAESCARAAAADRNVPGAQKFRAASFGGGQQVIQLVTALKSNT